MVRKFTHLRYVFCALILLLFVCSSLFAFEIIDPNDQNSIIEMDNLYQQSLTGVESNINWSSEFALPGFNGSVTGYAEFNGDLYVSGSFNTINDNFVLGLARWDGVKWSSVISSLNSYAIFEIVVYNNELIASGPFTEIDGVSCQGIAAWDGSNWRAITSNHDPNSSWEIRDMIVYNGELIVGGYFNDFENINSAKLIKWDGINWYGMGAGIDSIFYGSSNTYVTSLEIYDNDLYVGGKFSSMYGECLIKWDGVSWSGLGSGLDNGGETYYVSDLEVHNSSLIVGGSFDNAGGLLSERLAEWDGTNWQVMGFDTSAAIITKIISHNNTLFVTSKYRLYEDKSGTWELIPGSENFLYVYNLFTRNSELVVCGYYRGYDALVKWDGADWSTFDTFEGNGTDGLIEDMIVYDNKLVCVGDFDKAGNNAIFDIASWNGSAWEAMNNEFTGIMNTATIFNGNLVVGAQYMYNNDINDHTHLMQYDGVSWSMVGDLPLTTIIKDVAVYNDMLIVAGYHITLANEDVVHGIIGVDGSNAVVPIGSGTLGEGYSTNTNNTVNALEVYNGKLYAGGSFAYMDSIYMPRLAVYDGVEWQPVPGSEMLEYSVTALEVYDNHLFVGGYFGTTEERIMKFDGTTWYSLEGGSPNGAVYSLTATQDFLIVGGQFDQAGGAYANNVASWDGSCWGALGDGTNYTTRTSAQFLGDYYFGGYFVMAGEEHSNSIAKYSGLIEPCSCCRNERGNIDNDVDDMINITDLVYFVDYSFGTPAGPSPACIDEADVDSNGMLDIGDIVMLVSYMFGGGNPPNLCP